MSLWKIAWRSIQQRGFASSLTAFSMALGVMLVVAVLSIHGVVEKSFRNNASLGYNLIVGAKGGKLQLTLNTVYYLSQPIANVPYDYYMEFLSQEQRDQEFQNSLQPSEVPRNGKFSKYAKLVVPLCLGDYFGPFRVVGTTPEMFDQLRIGPDGEGKYEFAEGRNLQLFSSQNGFFEAVVGATVARELNVELGQRISTTHGDPEGFGHGRKFTVVGILAPSGTPNDRAVFVSIEGFYLMKGHAKSLQKKGDDGGEGGADLQSIEPVLVDPTLEPGQDRAEIVVDQLALKALPIEQREVTAILLQTASPLVSRGLKNSINRGEKAQAVFPVQEIFSLFNVFVKPVQMMLLVITSLICVVSGVSILVSIYNSMAERRHEIAVMRALGASRGTVLSIILLESVILSVGGGAVGWILGHGANWLLSPVIERRTGVTIGFFDFAPGIDLSLLLGGNLEPGSFAVSAELLLIPALITLAVIVGFLPALVAYRTDVAASLGD